jgi:transcription initiation factor TFIID TATA-box-binding protein
MTTEATAPVVQNIVCTCNLGTMVFLPLVVSKLPYAEYNPKRFSACTVRFRSPRSTALLFGSGKVVCTGTRSAMAARLALWQLVMLLQNKVGLDVGIYNLQIQNMVSSCSLGYSLDLHKFWRRHRAASSYEPSLFPGLIYRPPGLGKLVCLLFLSGRMVITGGKNKQILMSTYDLVSPLLQRCASDVCVPASLVRHDTISESRMIDEFKAEGLIS